ncbi:hypothetical protein [Bacillus tuaregi]|uniref:hypothetical protein n=1 Tax=Bacillus tuaregi TaxID=1816695 RepID=UPI0008F86DF3|nr:hypothetical protein [Bacillus tuaregi]
MNSRMKILQATKWAGAITLLVGMMTLMYGIVIGFNNVIGIGIGTMVGAIFIFLMGMFFITTEEMVENTFKGVEMTTPIKSSKVVYLKR